MKFRAQVISGLLGGIVCIAAATTVTAQDRTRTEVQPGTAVSTTTVERGEVSYVAGNDLIVKMDSGEMRHMTVPDSARATVDGKELSVHDLKPGMKLQRTITTTQTPRTVRNIRTIEGTVWNINAPISIILTLGDGTNKEYRIPNDQRFVVDGQVKTAFELKKGMKISATAVTESSDVVVSEQRRTSGAAPPPPVSQVVTAPAPPAPVLVGVLLFEMPAPASVAARPAPARNAAPEPAPTALPKTASPLPLLGLVGVMLCAISFGLRLSRQIEQTTYRDGSKHGNQNSRRY